MIKNSIDIVKYSIYSSAYWKFILNLKIGSHSLIRYHVSRGEILEKISKVSENYELSLKAILSAYFKAHEIDSLIKLVNFEISYLSKSRSFFVYLAHYFAFIWYSNDWDPFYVTFLDICENISDDNFSLTSFEVNQVVLGKINGFLLRDYMKQGRGQ